MPEFNYYIAFPNAVPCALKPWHEVADLGLFAWTGVPGSRDHAQFLFDTFGDLLRATTSFQRGGAHSIIVPCKPEPHGHCEGYLNANAWDKIHRLLDSWDECFKLADPIREFLVDPSSPEDDDLNDFRDELWALGRVMNLIAEEAIQVAYERLISNGAEIETVPVENQNPFD